MVELNPYPCEDLRQALTWHALHARVQRIEEALLAQDRHRKAMPK